MAGLITRWRLCALVLLCVLARKLRHKVPLRFQLLDFFAQLSFAVCGMMGAKDRWIGRSRFEALRTLAGGPPVKSGSLGGTVLSEDVELVPAGESNRTVRIRIYRPMQGQDEPRPVCVWIHGGGFVISHIDDEPYDVACRRIVEESGWIVVAPEYRLAPEHPFPAGLEDVYAVALWAAAPPTTDDSQCSKPLQGADGEGIILAGDSAGGNLATVVALLSAVGKNVHGEEQRLPVRHQLLVYPGLLPSAASSAGLGSRSDPSCQWIIPQSVMQFFESCYLGNDRTKREQLKQDWRVSPLAAGREEIQGMAAATIVLAEQDPLLDEGLAYARLLRSCGVHVTELRYEGMPHGFFCPDLPLALHPAATSRAIKQAVSAIRQATISITG